MKYEVYRVNLSDKYTGELLIAAENIGEVIRIAQDFFGAYVNVGVYGKCPDLFSEVRGIVFNTLRYTP